MTEGESHNILIGSRVEYCGACATVIEIDWPLITIQAPIRVRCLDGTSKDAIGETIVPYAALELIRCPECGSSLHPASECDMEGQF